VPHTLLTFSLVLPFAQMVNKTQWKPVMTEIQLTQMVALQRVKLRVVGLVLLDKLALQSAGTPKR